MSRSRIQRSLLAVAVAAALAGCTSDWDGEIPWPSHRNSEAKRPPKRAPDAGAVARSDPALEPTDSTDWQPIDPRTDGTRADGTMAPPPNDGFASRPPPPPPPADYQPPVPTAQGGVVSPTLAPGAQAAGTSAKDPLYFSFVGQAPPELAPDAKWLTQGVSTSVAGLRGQVVFLMFAFQSCTSCAQMTPYMKQWHEMYGPQGLSVVYVNNGRMTDEASATRAIRDEGLHFAYLHDKEGSTLAAYGIRSFPTAYVIDRSGKVVWEGTPLAVEAQVQELIQGLLAR